MMADVRKRKFKAIVVYRLDRISRNISDFTGLIDELTKLDVSFVSIREQFDTSTPMGRAMMFIISVFSQLERETIAERIRDNMHELAKTGRWLGGTAPLGYRSKPVSKITIDGKERKSFCLEPVPEEIDIPKLIYDLYTQSDSLTAVEAELLRRRIKTKLGKNFSRFAIKAILQNPVYMVADEDAYDFFLERKAEVCFPKSEFDGSCGIMAYNRTDQEKGRAMILLPMEEWIIALGKHPGIVPSKQWITVQQSLERNKSKGYRKPRNNEALLTGLIYCSCGERMYPKLTERRTGSGELIYTYVCKMKERSKRTRCNKRNANGNILDAAIIEQLKTLTEKDSAFMKQMEKSRQFYTGNREQYDTQLTKLREELAQNEKIVAGLLDSLGLVGDSIARPSMLRRIEELTEANRVIDCQIRELEGLVTANHLSDGEFDLLISILELVLRRLREAKFTADVAFPGQKFPQITKPVAAVHIEKVDRANMTVTVEVNIICPAAMGGTACEVEALRATEILRWSGAVCIQNGCTYDGISQVYVVAILATFTCVTEASKCSLGPGFRAYINDIVQPNAIAFSEEEVSGVQAEYVTGESAPAGASQGSSLWYIQLEELFPAGTPEKAEPVGAFTLEISTDVKTELYYHCRWTSVKREFSREGLRKTRKGIAMLRQEEE